MGCPWADAHRDLYGFECIFSSIANPISFEIHKVFLHLLVSTMKKNLLFKTAKHSKARDFFWRQDKKPWQG